ncbi:MAG: D-alanine--D-alanine ligase [Actinomycetia bacterium]|nr:D-alanine--D-alanine ligase [Actinomycetes bacterium]
MIQPAAAPRRPRVAVVFGGRSSEHAISCVSAGSVLGAIDRTVYDVVPVGITPEGRWVLEADDPGRLVITAGRLPEVDPAGPGVVLAGDPTGRGLVVSEPGQVPRVLGAVDVVFPLLHGPYGEDGTLQGLLELAGVPYVGSGVLASALAMDKAAMKVMLRSAGLPVGPYVVVNDRDWLTDPEGVLAEIRSGLLLPVFVKPARAGSSVGIGMVKDWADLPDAVEVARRHDAKVVVEQGVEGREIECGVLETVDGRDVEASVCAEIRVRGDHEFYDFAAKYLDDATQLDVPADIPPAVQDQVRRLACAAFRALDCEGFARVDFFLQPDGALVVNEVNTIPGFTPVSMFPRMWAESGVTYPELVDRLIRSALGKRPGLLR